MEFKNGYNLIYEKATTDGKALFASKAGIPTIDDGEIDLGLTKEEIAAIKLVYENSNGIVVSTNTIPTENDKNIVLMANNEVVLGESDTPVPPVPPTGLTPFKGEDAVPYQISKLILDPNGLSIDTLNNFLNLFNKGDKYTFITAPQSFNIAVEPNIVDQDDMLITINLFSPYNTVLVYSRISSVDEDDGFTTIANAWCENILDDEDIVISAKKVDTLKEYIVQGTVDSVNYMEQFNLINGKVIGCEYSSTDTFIKFDEKKVYSGIDFGNVVLGKTSATMDKFLADLDYEDDQCILLVGDLEDGTDYFLGAVYLEGVHALLVGSEGGVILYSDKDDIDFGNKGWKNLTDGKFMFPSSYTVNEGGINDTTPPTWNGVFVGAIEGEPGPTPTNYKEFNMPDAFESITLDSDISDLLSYNNIRIRLAVNGIETKTVYLTYSAGDINNGYQHIWSYKNDYTSTIDFAIALTNENTCVCFANTQAEAGTTIRIYPNNIILPDQLLPLEVADSYEEAEADDKLFSKIYFDSTLSGSEVTDIIWGTLGNASDVEVLCGKTSVNVSGYMDNLIVDCGIFFEKDAENNVSIYAKAFTPMGEDTATIFYGGTNTWYTESDPEYPERKYFDVAGWINAIGGGISFNGCCVVPNNTQCSSMALLINGTVAGHVRNE